MEFCDKKNPSEYTDQIRKWDRETLADGQEMAVEIEQLFNNTYYNKKHLEEVTNSIGEPNGIAQLDKTGKVPESQLPPQQEMQNASTSQKGIVQLSNSTNSNDITMAATPKAVNDVKKDTALTGTPTAPTASLGDKTDQIATTKFVYDAIRNKAFLLAKLSSLQKSGNYDPPSYFMDFTKSYQLRSSRLAVTSHRDYGPVWINNTDSSLYVQLQLTVRFDRVSSNGYPLRTFGVKTGLNLGNDTNPGSLMFVQDHYKFYGGDKASYISFGIISPRAWFFPDCQLEKDDTLLYEDCTFTVAEF